MNIDKEKLKDLAEAAPEGPWFGPEYAPGTSYVFDVDLGSLLHYESIETEQDACLRYVAAANPAMVLGLLAEIERLSPPAGQVSYQDQAEAWKAASSQDLRARGELLVQVEELEADNEALRKDAERSKRMLLDACVSIGSIGEALGLDMDADADTMIGTARELIDGLNRIIKECPLGSPGFAIACEVLGELGVQQEVQP
ncbi:hypothetical protein SAMN05216178_2014 [Pseudomonas saponiphila]|uniref:Ead/Ea22-like family protein n=1 Tax=Pseudomonas saponiphila TaxID=556534 RepID=A0A1H4LPC4_9PSED|nr:ead/Ea22-like family protein [Pseudomonas saponiphila]SEB72487.1 hypothetical protein SAMN05216178_2014 [Pseudomonas saponiphila]